MKRFSVRAYGSMAPAIIKVDDQDAYLLRSSAGWYVSGNSKSVMRLQCMGTTETLSQRIAGAPLGTRFDHLNGDRADYTRSNLRAKELVAA